ncbi:MAG TPA: type II toxin-antitoxin system HicA family toxin [bacterium]
MSGWQLIGLLEQNGYVQARSSGSHVRMIHPGPPTHAETVPLHKALKPGTLNTILTRVANHLQIDKSKLIRKL